MVDTGAHLGSSEMTYAYTQALTPSIAVDPLVGPPPSEVYSSLHGSSPYVASEYAVLNQHDRAIKAGDDDITYSITGNILERGAARQSHGRLTLTSEATGFLGPDYEQVGETSVRLAAIVTVAMEFSLELSMRPFPFRVLKSGLLS